MRNAHDAARRLPVLAATLALFTLPAAAAAQVDDEEWLENCRDQRDRRLEHYCAVQVQRVEAAGTPIRVDAHPNGPIQVLGWDHGQIEVHMRVAARAETEAEARELAERVRLVISGTTIAADGPERRRDADWHAGFVVLVPRRSDLQIETYNGPLVVEGVAGRMELSTRNGPLSLRDVGGDVHARTANGPLTVVLAGTSWDGAGLDAEAVNGPVTLLIPEGYSARLETGTINGPMSSDVPLTVERIERRSRISAVLGSGGPPVRVVTMNGPLSIKRR
ncbi:MAG TPA: hypothetical protein VF192_08325 [Longimicrobiales bacterium]